MIELVRRTVIISLVALAACSGTPDGASTPSPPASTTKPQPVAAASTNADQQARDAVAALLGTKPPEWQAERWMSSPPLTLAGLRGSVVMVRWWTAGCPFCSASAPALRAFDRTYRERGLRVIGMYHHKEESPFEPRVYEDTAREYGFTFPIAVDTDWRTLESWLHDANGKPVSTGWTSITFVLDKKGVIRHVHPGGQYVEGDAAHTELRGVIERLLAET